MKNEIKSDWVKHTHKNINGLKREFRSVVGIDEVCEYLSNALNVLLQIGRHDLKLLDIPKLMNFSNDITQLRNRLACDGHRFRDFLSDDYDWEYEYDFKYDLKLSIRDAFGEKTSDKLWENYNVDA